MPGKLRKFFNVLLRHFSKSAKWDMCTEADPGFPVGAVPTPLEAPTSDVDAFRQKRMSKTKELAPVGGTP